MAPVELADAMENAELFIAQREDRGGPNKAAWMVDIADPLVS